MVWLLLARLRCESFCGGIGYQGTKRAPGLSFGRFPVESVLLSFVADELLCVLLYAVVMLSHVFGLGISHRIHHVDRCEFVVSNAPRQNLLLTGHRIEVPLPSAVLFERNWEWVVVRPHHENLAAIGLFAPAIHGLICLCEVFDRLLVLRRIAGEDKVRRIRTEDRE